MNNNRYEIIVKIGGGEEEGGSAVAGSSTEGTSGEHVVGGGEGRNLQRAAKKLFSYGTISSCVDRFATYHLSQVELSTGAKEYEQRLSSSYSVAKQVVDAGVAFGVGIATGNPVLAAIGLVTSVVGSVVSYAQSVSTLRKKETLENVSISMQNMRAGVSGRRN